ncbi:MAG: hypothetical protein JNM41_00505 [Flavipsychrobacter sp.]|nr:hypothetical protein [Flavipsychrobacter sp.]
MTTKRSVFFWAPRMLGLAAIAFISLFALDSFEADQSLTTQLLHFAQHLIPSFILLALLAIAWKWEKVGGMAFIAIGLIFSPLVYMLNHGRNHFSIAQSLLVVLFITVPFIITGALFLLSHSKTNSAAA